MKIAIHHKEGSFSDRWIEYCKSNNIDYKLVDAYSNNIIQQLDDCNIFMWHHSNYDYRDALFAKQLLYSVKNKGLRVFPDFHTNWHFDDKVGQKYLLEAIDAPIVPSYVFYTKKEALEWIDQTSFPKVFKLRGGSGSSNVKLVKNKREAKNSIDKAFGRGFSQFDRLTHLKYRVGNFKSGTEDFTGVLKGIARLFIASNYSNQYPKEKGYVYFQEFIPNNDCDIRVIVIGDKAFAIKRMVRRNDFRASGSGRIIYDNKEIDKSCIKIAFSVNQAISSQCTAFDFVFDNKCSPKVVEISYGFAVEAYDLCPGYWDSNLNWYEGKFNPQEWMIEDVLKEVNKNSKLAVDER